MSLFSHWRAREMGDPAVEKANDPLAIEGLEEVFEVAPVTESEATDAAPVTDAKTPVTSASEPVPDLGSIPVEEAAQLMGTSVNALKKRLRKGTLRGTKVEAKHGEKWFVNSNELQIVLAPVTESEATDAAPVTDAKAPVTSAPEPVPTNAVMISTAGLLDRINELEKRLEGATFRNGYLEAENEGLRALMGAKDTQIKLLTDSQHQSRGAWSRFWSWFLGR